MGPTHAAASHHGGKVRWPVQLDESYGPPAGMPLQTDNGYLLAMAAGNVLRLDAANGQELGRVDTGRPLATGPVLRGDRLLIGGTDASLYEVKQP